VDIVSSTISMISLRVEITGHYIPQSFGCPTNPFYHFFLKI
jgi:hypothetical protein